MSISELNPESREAGEATTTHGGLRSPTASELSPAKRALLELRLRNAARKTIKPRLSAGPAALSFAQQRMWMTQQLRPNSPTHNLPVHLRLLGSLDVSALREALTEIVRRHETLRTTFLESDGHLTQRVSPDCRIEIPWTDISHLAPAQRNAEAMRMAKEHTAQLFDLERGPLVRAQLVRLDENEHLLLWTIHHIIWDAWSRQILKREIATLYEAFRTGRSSPLPPLPIQYIDFAVWQRETTNDETLKDQLAYWKNKLSGRLPVLEVPFDHPRPAESSARGASLSRRLPESLSDSLRSLAAGEGASVFMTVLTGFQTLLWRYTGEEDILVGSPIASRSNQQIEGLIGCFINMLVLRTDLGGDPTVRELLRRTKETALGAYSNQDVGVDRLAQEIRPQGSSSRAPLFQVMFNYRNVPRDRPPGDSPTAEKWPSPDHLKIDNFSHNQGVALFDLYVDLVDVGDSHECTFEYDPDLFDALTIERMLSHFQTLLEAMVADPSRPISRLPMIDADERHKLLFEWNQTQRKFSSDRRIHELFEAHASKSPDAVALRWASEKMTYGELNHRADQFARALRPLGAGPNQPIGICMDRSPEVIVSMLGILKAGAAYVPLDPNHPAERLDAIHSDAGFSLLVTQQEYSSKFSHKEIRLVFADSVAAPPPDRPELPCGPGAGPNDLCYVIYTSGSTGIPKGVAIEHRSLVNYIEALTADLNIEPVDSLLQFWALNSDSAAEEIYSALCSGSTLALRSDEMLGSAAGFFSECASLGVTVLDLPTAFFHELVVAMSAGSAELPRSIRLIMSGGEALSPQRLSEWKKVAASSVRLVNVYGPTEATIVSTMWDCDRWLRSDDPPLARCPIGRPRPNVTTYVLDARLEPLPIGVLGDLYLGGEGLARGYLNRPEVTAEKFIQNPFDPSPGKRLYRTGDLARYLPDGNLEFFGRGDHQVKVRGFRVELGEIENMLQQHPAVREVVVIAWDESGDKRLAAYVTAALQSTLDVQDLRGFLRRKLPAHMVPQAIVVLERFPLTTSGKLDRRALSKPQWGTQERNAEPSDVRDSIVRDYIEDGLASIWTEVFNLKRVGIHDSFFDLGGHSLLAVRMLSIVNKVFGVSLPLATLFDGATIAELARAIQGFKPQNITDRLVCLKKGADLPPFFFIHGDVAADGLYCRNLARHLDDRQPFYVLHTLGTDGGPIPERIEEMAAEYLRLIRKTRPTGPYLVGGFCNGGLIAYEVARQLRVQGEQVQATVLIAAEPYVIRNRTLFHLVNGFGNLLGISLRRRARVSLWILRRTQKWRQPAQGGIGTKGLHLVRDITKIMGKYIFRRFRRRPSPAGNASLSVETASDIMNRVIRHLRMAMTVYDPQPYDGPVFVLWPDEEPERYLEDASLGWKKVARRLEVRLVPGDHFTCCILHAKELGQRLGAIFEHGTSGTNEQCCN